jgi:hypothetical protein
LTAGCLASAQGVTADRLEQVLWDNSLRVLPGLARGQREAA